MIELVFARTDEERALLNRWCAEQFWPGEIRQFDECQALAIIDGDTLTGTILFHEFNPEWGTMEMTIAATNSRWLNRRTIRKMANYVFRDARCQAAVIRTHEAFTHIRSMLKRVGFKEYIIPRLRGRDRAEVVLVLSDDDWRRSKFNEVDK